MVAAAVRYCGRPETKGGKVRGRKGKGGGDRLGSVRGFVGCVGGEGSCAWHLSRGWLAGNVS